MSEKNYIKLMVLGISSMLNMGFYALTPQAENWTEIPIKEYDQLIERSTAFFEGNNVSFSVDVSISSFKTHQTSVPYERQRGYFIRSGNNYHHYIMGIHSFQNKNYRFVVDSTERNILVANPGNVETEKMVTSNYKQFHSYIAKVYRISLKETDRIKLVFNEKIKVSYIEMEFDKKGLLHKSTSFFRIKLREDASDKSSPATSPRIETVFSNYKGGIQPDYRKEFDESNFFQFVNGKFTAARGYADYQIKDTRLKTK